jgi:hypothetical protein
MTSHGKGVEMHTKSLLLVGLLAASLQCAAWAKLPPITEAQRAAAAIAAERVAQETA